MHDEQKSNTHYCDATFVALQDIAPIHPAMCHLLPHRYVRAKSCNATNDTSQDITYMYPAMQQMTHHWT